MSKRKRDRWANVTDECEFDSFNLDEDGKAFIYLEHDGNTIGLREDESEQPEGYRLRWDHEDDEDLGQWFMVERLIPDENETVTLATYNKQGARIGSKDISRKSAVEMGLIDGEGE